MTRLLLLSVALSLLLSPCLSLNVYVPAKSEQCFQERVPRGDKVVANYFVADGGNLDIDLVVRGPDAKVVYEKERGADGSFQFKAQQEGLYSVCFDNKMSMVSGKSVSFHLYVGDALHQKDAASAKSLSPLETSIVTTAEGMWGIKDAIGYARIREERHAQTVDSNNRRVVLFNAIKCSMLIAVAASQVWAIRGLFEKTRRA